MKPIRAIIFDFGGVVSRNDDLSDIGAKLAKKHQIKKELIDKITLQGWLKARINPKYDAAFWRELAGALTISEKQLMREYLGFPKPVPEVIQLIRALQKRYIVGMLSNQIETWLQALMKRWRIQKLFNPIVTSYSEGLAKPDPKIYRRLQKKLSVPFDECVYIDDRESNVVPAANLGMYAIHFKNPKQLMRELKKARVLF